jgi:hypothetical protein
MSDPETNGHPESHKPIDALQPHHSPEEECLSALLDLRDVQDTMRQSKAVSSFYAAFSGDEVPEDLRTRITTHAVEQNPLGPPHFSPQTSYVEGFEITATVVVDFDARESGIGRMLNLDFVKTSDGLELIQREYFIEDKERVSRYTRRISQEELSALARDAAAIKELIIEEDAELMKLGPLTEGQGEDGTRRFHIGDILSIITGKLVSPRGVDGIYDILGYMTDDDPHTVQLGRFIEECLPYLKQQIGETIQPYSEVPEAIKDKLALYKWLREVTAKLGDDPFLKVRKISQNDHVVMDVTTELELDRGPKIHEKIIPVDLRTLGLGDE